MNIKVLYPANLQCEQERDLESEVYVDMWCRRVGQRRSGFDATALHERQQLLRDLSQYILGQTSHAEHLISRAVNVVPEWHKLRDTYRTMI